MLPAGRYESQIRARNRFAVLVPICLFAILFLLYLTFKSWSTVFNVYAAAPVVIAGGLILIWAYPKFWDFARPRGMGLFAAVPISPDPPSGRNHRSLAVGVMARHDTLRFVCHQQLIAYAVRSIHKLQPS